MFLKNKDNCLCGKIKQKWSKHCRSCATKISNNNRKPETNKKISDTLIRKGIKPPINKMIGVNNPFFGKKHTEETKKIIKEKRKLQKMRKGFTVTEKTRKKISNSRYGKYKGKENKNWKGGISPLIVKIRGLIQNKEWIRNVFKKDNFTCKMCNKRGLILEAHHINMLTKIVRTNNIKSEEDAINCSELWDISNGITLCKECHLKETNKQRKKWLKK